MFAIEVSFLLCVLAEKNNCIWQVAATAVKCHVKSPDSETVGGEHDVKDNIFGGYLFVEADFNYFV